MDREEFQCLCLLLYPELQDVDIPHQTTVHKHIIKTSEEVLANLALDIQVSLYLIPCAENTNFCLEQQSWTGVFYHRFVV